MDDVLAVVGKRKHRLNLAGLQELVRLATTQFRLSQDSQPQLTEAMNIIEQELQELQAHDMPLNDITPRIDRFLAFLRQAPPQISKSFFIYGILDAATQVTRCLCPSQTLQKELEKFIFQSNVTEYRYKAVRHSKSPTSVAYIKTGRGDVVFCCHTR